MLFKIYGNPPSITELRSLLPARAPYADVNLCVSHKFRRRLIYKIQKDRWQDGVFLREKLENVPRRQALAALAAAHRGGGGLAACAEDHPLGGAM